MRLPLKVLTPTIAMYTNVLIELISLSGYHKSMSVLKQDDKVFQEDSPWSYLQDNRPWDKARAQELYGGGKQHRST